MSRTRIRIVVFTAAAAAAAAAALGAASPSLAAPAVNSVCSPFMLNGQKILWEVIGTWTCKSAKPWIVKLDKNHVSSALGKAALHNGPPRYHCFATQESASGRVIDGICYLGTLAFPKSGFTW